MISSLPFIFFFLLICILILPPVSNAQIVKGIRCTTTQSFVWPLKDPNGIQVEKTTTVSHEELMDDLNLAKLFAGQGAWKKCRQNLGSQFKAHWNQFGVETAPFPKDEFGDPRSPRICFSFVSYKNLYSCEEISEPTLKNDNDFTDEDADVKQRS